MQQMYDATEGDGQKQIMQKIYDNCEQRSGTVWTMPWKNRQVERTGKVSISRSPSDPCLHGRGEYLYYRIQQKSVNEMDEAATDHILPNEQFLGIALE